jgi:hypothetical protein
MRFLPVISLSTALLAAPAIAQTAPANADTYRQVIEHGVVILTSDLEIDVIFTPDGRFKALGGLSKGNWKIVGDKLCSTPDETSVESCAAYPAGKKSGDTFEIEAPTGKVNVKIK